MFPIRDDQPRTTIPYVNYSIILVNVGVFAFEFYLRIQDPKALYSLYYQFGTIPHNFQLAFSGKSQLTVPGVFFTILSSMFMHVSVLHLVGNMWVLWIFGDNIEDHLGQRGLPVSLSALRIARLLGPHLRQSRLRDSKYGREWGHRGSHGCVLAALSASSGAASGYVLVAGEFRVAAGVGSAGLLDRAAVAESDSDGRAPQTDAAAYGRSRILGTFGRFFERDDFD